MAVGTLLVCMVLAIALAGPYVAPHDPAEILAAPYEQPGSAHFLGTDFLGRDVFSRVLAGGRQLVMIAALATAIGWGLGVLIGILAGLSRTLLDPILMRAMDVLLAFPPLLFLLVLVGSVGGGVRGAVAGISIAQVPSVARLVRAATLEVSVRGYIEAAVARGERLSYLLIREVLPNISAPLVAALIPGFSGSILAIAALGFFGLGLPPPTPDWGGMISENRLGMTLTPWPVVVPSVLLASIAVGLNLAGERLGMSRRAAAQR